MEHTKEEHSRRLQLLCRLCCKRVQRVSSKTKSRRNYSRCKYAYRDDILKYFRFDISHDIEDIHSNEICYPCYMYIYHLKRRPVTVSKGRYSVARIRSCVDWMFGVLFVVLRDSRIHIDGPPMVSTSLISLRRWTFRLNTGLTLGIT